MIGPVIEVILRSPHLVLTDFGGDDRFSLGLLKQFFDNVLRLNGIFRLFICEWFGTFPIINLLEPCFSPPVQIPQINFPNQLIQLP